MENLNYTINIPREEDEKLIQLKLEAGDSLFILGANGVGKSALIQRIFMHNPSAKRILAHRKNWFESNSVDITPSSKKRAEENALRDYQQRHIRWKNSFDSQKISFALFDLVDDVNTRARTIAEAVDKGDYDVVKNLSKVKSVLLVINELLSNSNLPIEISLEKNDQLFASKNGGMSYSIAELSDGEKNALLIAIEILTAGKNQLIIIDEPERHLHRSIISPLLSTLFAKRNDCSFIISTHDINLPIDNPTSQVLLLRDCKWAGDQAARWDADLISDTSEIPEDTKHSILGSKRNILFIEGIGTSLDYQLYKNLFPEYNVIPKGDCRDVINAVEGLRSSQDFHWLKVVGLIDSDDRTEEQKQKLINKSVAVLNCYSVESLYYHPFIVQKVAKKYSEITGDDSQSLFEEANSGILDAFKEHKERMCARLVEKKVKSMILGSIPNYRDIQNNTVNTIDIGDKVKGFLECEESMFQKLVNENSLSHLIMRYPIRETQVKTRIAKGFQMNQEKYEATVRNLAIKDDEVKLFYKNQLKNLFDLIDF